MPSILQSQVRITSTSWKQLFHNLIDALYMPVHCDMERKLKINKKEAGLGQSKKFQSRISTPLWLVSTWLATYVSYEIASKSLFHPHHQLMQIEIANSGFTVQRLQNKAFLLVRNVMWLRTTNQSALCYHRILTLYKIFFMTSISASTFYYPDVYCENVFNVVGFSLACQICFPALHWFE